VSIRTSTRARFTRGLRVPRILLADSDQIERDLLREAFIASGHVVIVARDGDEALTLAERERPDAAVLALLLGRRDGFTLLLHLRARPALRAMPVALIGSEPAALCGGTARVLGAVAYFERPWSPSEIVLALEERLPRASSSIPPGASPLDYCSDDEGAPT